MDFINLSSHIMVFLSLYFEVFFLLSYMGRKKTVDVKTLDYLPPVTILIPCFNEEKSVVGTINSVLDLNYPKENMQIIVIDDGSTDNTYNEVLKHFKINPIVEIYKKENGGKFTALNFGIEKAKHRFIGSLDADSYVEKESLRRCAFWSMFFGLCIIVEGIVAIISGFWNLSIISLKDSFST